MFKDQIDERIVALLERNARSSFAQIGTDVGLSAPAVKRRVDRLEADGVIIGYRAIIDRSDQPTPVEAFVELFCRDHTVPAQIQAIIDDVDEVIAAFTVSGDADAILHIRTADITALEATLEKLRMRPSVDRSRSTIVLSKLIDRSTSGGLPQ